MEVRADTNAADCLVPFSLRGIDGKTHTLDGVRGEAGTLVMFLCNHCPYVLGVIDPLVGDCRALQAEGIGCVAVMPNDTKAYPADSFDNMVRFAQKHGFTFPYLIDETQEVARAYGAVCTPDLFGFNRDGMLKYRGRVDSAGSRPATGNERRELREAMTMIAQKGEGPSNQMPSMGCSIKWRR